MSTKISRFDIAEDGNIDYAEDGRCVWHDDHVEVVKDKDDKFELLNQENEKLKRGLCLMWGEHDIDICYDMLVELGLEDYEWDENVKNRD